MKLGRLTLDKQVIVSCGAGGVGKTTVSAALALSGARTGRRCLVLTIDPARRLAQALGIPPTGTEPAAIDLDGLRAQGIAIPDGARLDAWMLDPASVLESVVDRFAPDPDAAARIRETRLFSALKQVMAGLQEHTAAEALYDFARRGTYDLIVLDTPPSRNALDFLDAPRRLARFLDERTLAIFAPRPDSKPSAMVRAAARVVNVALSKAFTPQFADELQQFLSAFGTLFSGMRVHATGVRELLKSERSSFVIITSPDEAAFDEALFFDARVRELGLNTAGFVLNRSYAVSDAAETPQQVAARNGDDPILTSALAKMEPMAQIEAERSESDRELLDRLAAVSHGASGEGAVALPYLDETVEDLAALLRLSDAILDAV